MGTCRVMNLLVIPGSSFENSSIKTYFKVEYISKMIAFSFKTSIGFVLWFCFLGHVGNCKSCEDGPLGVCAQSAASPLPFPGPGVFVLFCMEATFSPVGGLQ